MLSVKNYWKHVYDMTKAEVVEYSKLMLMLSSLAYVCLLGLVFFGGEGEQNTN